MKKSLIIMSWRSYQTFRSIISSFARKIYYSTMRKLHTCLKYFTNCLAWQTKENELKVQEHKTIFNKLCQRNGRCFKMNWWFEYEKGCSQRSFWRRLLSMLRTDISSILDFMISFWITNSFVRLNEFISTKKLPLCHLL